MTVGTRPPCEHWVPEPGHTRIIGSPEHEPTRATQPDLEQPGCLHAAMDLYKYAMWFQQFVGSDLVADCFEVARKARELDMRAAPYDLADLG